jgi:MFS family permease
MLGVGSLLCESADGIPLLLTGRTVQGLGAGGLMVLSYAVYVDMNTQSESESGSGSGSGSGPKFLAAISVFVAAGTVCGPFIGAALSDSHHWVTTVPLLEKRELTTVPALDFPSEHTYVRGTWCACIQQ